MDREQILQQIGKRWAIPHVRIQDTFNIRTGQGKLVPLVVPEPQRDIIDEGLLGTGRKVVEKGVVHRRFVNKGRQIGYSYILAAEAILIAQDYPNTFQYYVATMGQQASDWLEKIQQLCLDVNYWPTELGGGPIINITNLAPAMSKVINNCTISGFAANPAGMRGPTAINCILDEFAWMILRKKQQDETLTAVSSFLDQGGQLTIQSTPRTSTDKFMDLYNNPSKHGGTSYYKPVFENPQELDINLPLYILLDNSMRKDYDMEPLTQQQIEHYITTYSNHPLFIFDKDNQILRQKFILKYSWKNPIELEAKRYSDVETFKQEYLGMAIDERYKVLKGEWIYNNLVEGKDWLDRRGSLNKFAFGIDIAKQKDLFIVVIGEQEGQDWYIRRVEIMPMGQNYTVSAQRIAALYDLFKPTIIGVDNTGGGIVFCDILESIPRIKNSVLRVDFTTSTKENMAEGLKHLCQDGRFHMINATEEHRTVIQHLLKVERQALETSTKYTGKDIDQEGRDDGFWACALIILAGQQGMKNPPAAFGKMNLTRKAEEEGYLKRVESIGIPQESVLERIWGK